jgi:hypothetical protein
MTTYSYERVGDEHEIYKHKDGQTTQIASAAWVEDAMVIVTALNEWEGGVPVAEENT